MSYIDSRDLIEEAASLRAYLVADHGDDFDLDALVDNDEPNALRVRAIDELADAGITDWEYGATLIPEDEFTEYARQLAEDIGAIQADYSWPASHIDWTAAADALRQDYMDVEFDGTTYLVRA